MLGHPLVEPLDQNMIPPTDSALFSVHFSIKLEITGFSLSVCWQALATTLGTQQSQGFLMERRSCISAREGGRGFARGKGQENKMRVGERLEKKE